MLEDEIIIKKIQSKKGLDFTIEKPKNDEIAKKKKQLKKPSKTIVIKIKGTKSDR
jgi:hypothetical protein